MNGFPSINQISLKKQWNPQDVGMLATEGHNPWGRSQKEALLRSSLPPITGRNRGWGKGCDLITVPTLCARSRTKEAF
jgi:hypothetical protein